MHCEIHDRLLQAGAALLVFACLALSGPSQAQTKLTLPSEILYYKRLPDFVKAHESGSEASGQTLIEYVPKGQTVTDWTEMLTVNTFFKTKNRNPAELISRIHAEWTRGCGKARTGQLKTAKQHGAEVAWIQMACQDPTPREGTNISLKKFEFVYVKVLQGAENLYIIQRAWHSDTQPLPNPPANAFFDVINSAQVCPNSICAFGQ